MTQAVIIGKTGTLADIQMVEKTAWLTNGTVAWQIPTGLIAVLFNAGAYRRPRGWYVRQRLPRRYRYTGECGERRVAPAPVG